jgi:hypothetical protein
MSHVSINAVSRYLAMECSRLLDASKRYSEFVDKLTGAIRNIVIDDKGTPACVFFSVSQEPYSGKEATDGPSIINPFGITFYISSSLEGAPATAVHLADGTSSSTTHTKIETQTIFGTRVVDATWELSIYNAVRICVDVSFERWRCS